MSSYPPGYFTDPRNPELWPAILIECRECGNRLPPEDATALGDVFTPEHERVYLCGLLRDEQKRGCVHKWMCRRCGAIVYGADLNRKTMTCADCEWEWRRIHGS